MKMIPAQAYCFFLFLYYCKKDHMNENISDANLLLVPFVDYCTKYHTNENISGANLLLVPFYLLL